jgi:RNA ligase (TIGR02306 family)
MAFFGVTVEEIETVNPIEGADRIQVATVKGLVFNFVIAKDSFKPGDKVLYFPIDSLLPQALAEKLGVAGKLAGKNKDRVKTVKLRGVMSQGIVGNLDIIGDMSCESLLGVPRLPSTEEITAHLGVTKYEPPEVVCQGGKLVRHAEGVSTYDIEGADRYPVVVNELLNQQVYITEKVEGSNWYGGVDAAGEFVVGQRSGAIIPDDGNVTHTWWTVAAMQGLLDAAAAIRRDKYPGKSVIIRGEIAGGSIQGNIYKLPKMQIFAFDILVDGQYVDALTFLALTTEYKIQTAPMLSLSKTLHEWLDGKTVKDASHGKSLLGDTIREGIVIKPIVEQYSKVLGGRLFIKQRDPIYLDKTGN